ncbi:hypothetical protein JCM17845_19050 [Iodidimonas gelatinilytica]|uniref:Uncharacterized protein n=1 Tax=Iodidimonas gelatinilytica TaxID=1236966 RepID=A0A5A7MZ51_9PROT|nr:hypothetical protein [Iodidimonas gelatinilytica]GER01282.1 hypothetical protein JCM17845_19050 [Iodidimonas gelatinilytica]
MPEFSLRRLTLALSFGTGAMVFAITAVAQDKVPESSGVQVEATFSKGLARRMDSINSIEQSLEDRFRRTGSDDRSAIRSSIQRFAKIRTYGTEWAGERLIPDVEDYTVANLLEALTMDNLQRAAPQFKGTIHYTIKTMRVSSHPVAFLTGANSYISGKVEMLAPDGRVLKKEKLTANLVVDPSVDRSYDGDKYAFVENDEANRVGPTLAYFVEQALEDLWPNKKKEIEGPIIIRLSGPNEQIRFNR